MIIPADTPVKEMSTFALHMMLEDIQAELYERNVKKCQDIMTKLYQTIEITARPNYNIYLIDAEGNEMRLRDICEIYDKTLDVGYAFSDPSLYEEEEKE